MNYRLPASLGVLALGAVFLTSRPASAQSGPVAVKATSAVKAASIPRTADGHPDLQGFWSNVTLTPLERPRDLTGKEFFTEQEAVEYEKNIVQRRNRDQRQRGTVADVQNAYNDFWWDSGTKVVKTRRTSLVVDPPDGRIPALTPERQKQLQARAEAIKKRCEQPGALCQMENGGAPGPADGPEDRPLMERCLNFAAGPPILPGAYNNNYQIAQGPGFVAIDSEMAHDVRMIPLDAARPHLPANVRQWMGDPRGHWEGDTLVVDTTNFTGTTRFRGSDENLHLIERFTPADANTLIYRFTIDDPTAFTKPWTAEVPMLRAEGPMIEYACNEGNYGLAGILAAARAEEKAAAAKAAGK